jgi:hypothetical protein
MDNNKDNNKDNKIVDKDNNGLEFESTEFESTSSTLDQLKLNYNYKYHREYCDLLVKHMADGLTFRSFAAIPHVTEDQLRIWVKKHPEFKQAYKQGLAQYRLYYETILRAACLGQVKNFPQALFTMLAKNHLDWTDRTTINADINVNRIQHQDREYVLEQAKRAIDNKVIQLQPSKAK